VQPGCVEQVLTLSWAHGVGVPLQLVTPVDQKQLLCPVVQLVSSVKLEHVDVPVHSVLLPLWPQPQPACAMHVVIVASVVHAVAVPLQVLEPAFQVQPACAMQVVIVTKLVHAVAVPPHTDVQPGHSAQP
jgi:hypothetical protein